MEISPRLTLLSWNLQLLSPQAQARKERALAIAGRILALRPDVVCLQEVWCPAARALLLSCLATGYAHIFAPAADHRCGLVIASLHPLRMQSFHQFRGARGMERIVFQKGVAAVLVQPRGAGAGIVVTNTHTQSDFWGSSARARALQMLELGAVVQQMEERAASAGVALLTACPVIVAGDLNAAAGTEEAAQAMSLLGSPVDVHAAAATEPSPRQQSFPLGVWSRRQRKYILRTPTKRLDYILLSRRSTADAVAGATATIAHSTAYAGTAPLSDHAPLLLSLSVPPPNTA